jgi:NAD(P)-dependent dehydrogenase (short-subunit alcohol dehydrogenase family)
MPGREATVSPGDIAVPSWNPSPSSLPPPCADKYEGEFDRSDVNAFQSQLQRLTFEDWNTTYNLDVVAQYFVTVGLLHLLAIGRDNEFGYVPSIVNNTSIAALFKGSVGGGWA